MKALAPVVTANESLPDLSTSRMLVFPLLLPHQNEFWVIVYSEGQKVDIYSFGFLEGARSTTASLK
jgi:hypothetical protein